MTIQFFGHSCFKISGKNKVLVTDPYPKEIGLKPPKISCDIVTISHHHWDHCAYQNLKGDFKIIDLPGEYEIDGIFIKGIKSFHDESEGKERGLNTIFNILIEDIWVCHLGDLGQSQLSEEQVSLIGEVDVLMIPVGGVYTIGPKEAKKIIHQLEPKIIIPMHYWLPSLKIQELKKPEEFFKEKGVKPTQEEKLSLKKKDLSEKQMKVIWLKEMGKI